MAEAAVDALFAYAARIVKEDNNWLTAAQRLHMTQPVAALSRVSDDCTRWERLGVELDLKSAGRRLFGVLLRSTVSLLDG
jgi:hypothetical protein